MSAAKEVVVLLNRDFRISRNIRLKWYFDHLNLPVSRAPSSSHAVDNKAKGNDDGLQVVSVLSCNSEEENIISEESACITTDTKVTFLSSGYRFVFGLDLSASLLRVDTFQNFVMLEAVLVNLQMCLVSLLESYSVEEGTTVKPDIYITVFAQWHGTKSNGSHQQDSERVSQKVLIQGCHLTEDVIPIVLEKVEESIYDTVRMDEPGRHKSALQNRDDILIGILRTGLLALRLLPSNTSSGVVIITDGVLGEPNPTSLERLLRQCQNTTTSCSFIHINPSASPLCDFGCISNGELMQFIANCTKGQYINAFSSLSNASVQNNIYQQALLPWTFQVKRSLAVTNINASLDRLCNSCSSFELRNVHASPTDDPVLLSHKQDERTIKVDLVTVVSARLREGYEIKSTKIVTDTLEIILVLQWWKNFTSVEYRVSSAWPMKKNSCKVEVYISGTYEFLLDVSKRHQSSHWTRPRKMVVHRLLRFFQDLMHSDHMLQYLWGFTNDSTNYTISDSLRQGQTLYYLPPNSSLFELSTQVQHIPSSFSSYWKPILSLDVNIWQQWLHIHRIEVILQHELPLPKDLHMMSSSGRHSVSCRVAFSQLVSMLRDWCTFVLLENHTYVKFIYTSENIEKPCSFFLVRLSIKSPAMVLKLAFLIGLSGKVRKHYVCELRERVASLMLPNSGSSSGSSTKRVRHASSRLSPSVKPHRPFHSASDKPCVIVMHKPLDQVLVRYMQLPEDYLSNFSVGKIYSKPHSDVNEQFIRMRDMQWYLQHQRYVWSLTNNMSTPLSIDVACHLASLLLKIRLTEGYQIAYSSSGVVNLTREFPMQTTVSFNEENVNDYCLVQFVIFPPKLQVEDTSNSAGDTDDEDGIEDSPMKQKEIVFAVEVWVEPQYGFVKQKLHPSTTSFYSSKSSSPSSSPLHQSDNFSEVPYYEGLSCDKIIMKVLEHDSICVCSVVTLEHLRLMCTSHELAQTLPQKCHPNKMPSHASTPQECSSSYRVSATATDHQDASEQFRQSDGKLNQGSDDGDQIQYFPCIFDLVVLLDQSPRIRHLFMTLAKDLGSNNANATLFANFHNSLKSHCDCTVLLTKQDQNSITKHIISRKNGDESTFGKHLSSDFERTAQGSWSCYLKQGGNGQVLVIILPATYRDFLSLFSILTEEPTGNTKASKQSNTATSEPSFPRGSADLATKLSASEYIDSTDSAKVYRRLSFKRLASSDESATFQPSSINVRERTLSVFIYNCSMQMLVSGFLNRAKNANPIKWPDSLQDHRLYTDDISDNLVQGFRSILSSKDSPSTPKSATFECSEQNDDVFSLTSPENDHLQNLGTSVVKFYHRSFVVGVFSAVQTETKSQFSTDDLLISTDYFCNESVHEIDITDFILLNCPQVAEFKNQNFNPSISDIDPQTTEAFESDELDIEDVCASQAQVGHNVNKFLTVEQHQPSEDLVEVANENTETQKIAVRTLPKPENNDFLQENDGGTTKAETTSASFSLSNHRKSAFATVQRTLRSKASECENLSLNSSSSEEEAINDRETRRKTVQLHKRERKLTTTRPVKRVASHKHTSVCLPAGWSNLPEFPVSLLNVPHTRHQSGSSEQVEKHFNTLLKSYCHKIPAVPYLYYAVNANDTVDIQTPKLSNQQTESDIEDVQFVADAEDVSCELDNKEIITLPDSLTDHLSLPCFEDNDSSVSSENEREINPLFLYMTCTVRDKKTGNCGSTPVKCLPISLKYVIDSLDKPCETVDLSEIKITLDLIWIFLPSLHTTNTVPTLPLECTSFVTSVKHSIKWLLNDEIISSLRTSEPINTTTLTKVSDHVRTSDSSNCVMYTTPLQFIFGVEKSKELLCLEFEKLRMENYKLKKEGQFYFLSLERAFLPISNSSFMNVNKEKNSLIFHQDGESMKEKSVAGSGENAFSPKANTNKPSFLTTIDTEHDNNGMKASTAQHEQSSCISLTAIESDCTETPKLEKKIKKASSSSELLALTLSTRRCTSVSSIPLVASTSKESSQATPLSVNKSSMNISSTPSPVIHHPHLRISLSTGKDSIGLPPLNIHGKSKTTSMPVTPLDTVNVESEKFIFSSKGDGRQSCGLSRDLALSPSSEYSPRQFSQTSWLGSGYEGEESDCEDEEDYRERLEEGWSQLPNFWLIICIDGDTAHVYFHRRSSAKVIKPVALEHDRIFKSVCQNLTKACRAVNQILLLKKLHDSRLCHSLLVEESPENIWKRDDYSMIYPNATIPDGQIGEDTHQSRRNDYLAANMDFPPGYFECDCVLQQCIALCHCIAFSSSGGNQGVGGKTFSALSTVRALMKNFTVVNQQNMFVYQVPDGTVYYCRMYEEGKKVDSNGRRSSLLFQSNDSNTVVARRDSTGQNMLQPESEPKLFLSWYGVHALTQQHSQALEELKEGIKRKLNDAALDCITVRLNRNPQYKLTPADVILIQPRQPDSNDQLVPKAPDDTVSFSLPPELANKKSMSSLVYYIHQNLLLFLVLPRYTEPNSAHFLPYSVNESSCANLQKSDSALAGNLYLFSGLKEKGRQGQGIACVCLDFNCEKDSYSPPVAFDSSLNVKWLKSLSVVEDLTDNLGNQTAVHFHFWSRGSVKVADLHDKLQMAVQHAVCDAIMEQLLRLPFTPIKLVKTDAMKSLFQSSEKKETPFLQNLFPKFGNISKTPSQDYKVDGNSILPGSPLDGLYDKLMCMWFVHMKSVLCPTVSVFTGDFKSIMSLEQGVQNVSDILDSVLVDSDIRTLCKLRKSGKEWKFTQEINSDSLMLGKYYQWMLLSRNFNLWKKTTGSLHTTFVPNPATAKLQKFPPFDSSIKPDASPCPQHALVMSSSYIPRQHFAYVVTEKTSVKIFLYNVSGGKCNEISQKLHHCTKFHNARHDLLQNLTLQKLGLFKHVSSKEIHSSKPPIHHGKFPVDFLIRHNKVSVVDKRKFRFTAVDQHLGDLLQDVPHGRDFGISAAENNDKVSQFGHQCIATLRHKRALKEARKHLDILWQRSTSSICKATSATLDVLLSLSRLIHSASSPVLLDSYVRQEHVALFMKDRCVPSKSELTDHSKQHTVLSRTSSFLGTYRRRSGDSMHKMSEKLNPETSPKESKPDICRNSFEFMSDKFTELYAEHWKGFVKLQPQMTSGNVNKKPEFVSEEGKPSFLTDRFLYRALAGGIILIVHSFLPDRFDVKLYCIDMSSLHEQTIHGKQKTLSFLIRECEKVKRHMKVHLFSLEMHLRCVQWYLNGNHSLIRSGYNFIDLLNGLSVCYGALLDDFQSQIYHDVIDIPCPPVNCHDLYDFIIENASIFGLKTLCVRRSSGLTPVEHILFTVGQELTDHTSGCSAASHGNYNICSIISKAENSEPGFLKLSYFILISHKRMPSVSSDSKKNFPEVITSAQAQIRKHFKISNSQAVDRAVSSQQIEKSDENIQEKLLPLSLMQEVIYPPFLVCEKTYLETMLYDVGSAARRECYRHHHLWNGLIQMCNDKVSGKPLNLIEFQKLLDWMETVPASEFDANIVDLLLKSKNIRQGQLAQKGLLKKFPKTSTTLSSSDNGIQHVCILSPQDVHVMAVLTVDFNKQDIDLFLVKPRPESKKFHTGDSDVACKQLILSVCNCISITTWLSWL